MFKRFVQIECTAEETVPRFRNSGYCMQRCVSPIYAFCET